MVKIEKPYVHIRGKNKDYKNVHKRVRQSEFIEQSTETV